MALVKWSCWLGSALFVALICASAASATVEYNITDLGAQLGPGRPDNYASAINASGEVAGWTDEPNFGGNSAIALGDGEAQVFSLPAPYNLSAAAASINDEGQVVGNSGNNVVQFPPASQGFLYSNGSTTDLGTLGGVYSAAFGINNAGQIMGESSVSPTSTTLHAFLDQNGVMEDLGTLGGDSSSARAINQAGEIVGYAETADGSGNAFLYENGSMIDLGTIAGTGSTALAINSNGQIVGASSFVSSDDGEHAFLYSNGQMTDLGPQDSLQSEAESINDLGQIVGYAIVPGSDPLGQYGFVDSDGVMTDLNSLVDPSLGWSIIDASGINDAGQIAADGYDSTTGQADALLLTPIPEPLAPTLLLPVLIFALALRPTRH